jgi:hypothetical protein
MITVPAKATIGNYPQMSQMFTDEEISVFICEHLWISFPPQGLGGRWLER